MTKFKVGDTVKINVPDYTPRGLDGKTGTITRVPTPERWSYYRVVIPGHGIAGFEEDEDWPFEAGELELVTSADDPVNHPAHYTSHPSGIECIQITEHMSFPCGNAIKYIWRADLKGAGVEDLKKAKWYIEREIAKREAG